MYNTIAPYYDILMTDTDYPSIAGYIEERLKARGVKTVCDCGCGTGRVTLELAKAGYEMTGVDISGEMLSLADKAAVESGLSVNFVLQDMKNLSLFSKTDAVICCLDGVNHLKGKKSVIEFFRSVKKNLNDGGIFIFDINNEYKFEKIYAENDYIIEEENVLCAWSNYYDREMRFCDFQLSLFVKEKDGRYSRLDDTQREYCYSQKEIASSLLASGFSDYSFENVTEDRTVFTVYN